ncbi:MAG TPA: MBL fold metallo-hydrolase [Chitinophagaceae bacterium]|nr:MBL fold metallo-hydrolase [Chitinophagaceae bacterium]
MKITFLGTGTSQGVPMIGCNCEVCTSSDAKDNRLRSSILIQHEGINIVVDTTPDFRYQMLRAQVKHLDAVLITHHHKDHLAGMDDVRAFNFFQKEAIDIYAMEETQEIIRKEFSYAFAPEKYPGVPQINLKTIKNKPIHIKGLKITPIHVLHHKLPVVGFRIGDFTYITDANYIAPEEKKKIEKSRVLVLNALRKKPKHISHFTLSEAVELSNEVNAETTYFTHISHQMGTYQKVQQELPKEKFLSYDQLQIETI